MIFHHLGSLADAWQTAIDAASDYWFDLTPDSQGLVRFAAAILGGVAISFLIRWAWSHVFLAIARRTKTDLDEAILKATRGPVQFVLLVASVVLAAHLYEEDLPDVTRHPSWGVFQGVLYVILVLAVIRLAYAVLKATIEWYGRRATDGGGNRYASYASVFRIVAKLVLTFIALTIVLDHFHVQITGLLATAGIASLAVALAAQETLANMFAGFALMIDRPFRAGDRVQLSNGQAGDVIEVGLRSTRILSFDNTVVAVPNSEMAKSHIVNFNAPDAHVKIRCTLGVAYGSDLRKVKTILLAVMGENSTVLKDPAPAVFFTEFGDSALKLLFVCWVADYREQFRVLDELNMAIKDRFEAEGVEIPFPQQDVHIRDGGPPAP